MTNLIFFFYSHFKFSFAHDCIAHVSNVNISTKDTVEENRSQARDRNVLYNSQESIKQIQCC